ncbi:MAG: hypothetical protein ACT4P7_22730 [Gemmatimonadaceae bacterium]
MPFDAADWGRIQELFHALTDRSHAEQVEALDRLSVDQPDIAREVRAMLLADATGPSLLDLGVASAVNDLLRPPAPRPSDQHSSIPPAPLADVQGPAAPRADSNSEETGRRSGGGAV